MGQGLLIFEVSRSHKATHHSWEDFSGRVISPSQRPLPDNTQHSQQTSMPPVGFELTISAGERPQIYALDRAATGTDNEHVVRQKNTLKVRLEVCTAINMKITLFCSATPCSLMFSYEQFRGISCLHTGGELFR